MLSKKIFALALVLLLALSFAAFGADAKTVRLGVTASVYEELWAPAKKLLAEQGINLEIIQFTDYITPNRALDEGDIDLNAFQHRIYFNAEVANHGYKISNIGNTFVLPLNLYSLKVKKLDEIKDGDIIAIPNDPTNGGRAVKILADAGLITLREGAGFNPTKDDIASYKVKIKIEELAANAIPAALPDITAGIINGTFALDYGLKASDAVFEDQAREKEYWNLIAARTADLENPEKFAVYKAVVDAYHSDAMKEFTAEFYGGFFKAVGWDEDLLAK